MLDLTRTIRAIAQGDHQAFTALYRAERGAMLAFAGGMLAGDLAAAEDTVDAAFMAVWQTAGRYAGESRGEARAWLRRIVRNKAVDWLRASGRYDLGYDGEPERADPDLAVNPEAGAIAQDAGQLLAQAMARLSIGQREAVMLCYFEDLPLAEIARIAECPEGTVKTRLYHARLALRRELEAFARAD